MKNLLFALFLLVFCSCHVAHRKQISRFENIYISSGDAKTPFAHSYLLSYVHKDTVVTKIVNSLQGYYGMLFTSNVNMLISNNGRGGQLITALHSLRVKDSLMPLPFGWRRAGDDIAVMDEDISYGQAKGHNILYAKRYDGKKIPRKVSILGVNRWYGDTFLNKIEGMSYPFPLSDTRNPNKGYLVLQGNHMERLKGTSGSFVLDMDHKAIGIVVESHFKKKEQKNQAKEKEGQTLVVFEYL